MDLNHGLSPAQNPANSAGEMTDDQKSDINAASHHARLHRPTGEQASRVAQNIDKGNSGPVETDSAIPSIELRQQMKIKQEGHGQFFSNPMKHSQESEENPNGILNHFHSHSNGELYRKEYATRSKTSKRKRDDTEEQRGSIAPSLPVSIVRLSPAMAMQKREEGPEKACLNTQESANTARIRNLEAENNRLKSEIDELERELENTRTELLEELSELRSKNYVNPTKDADSEIGKDWEHLDFLIQQFVSNHFPTMLLWEDIQRAGTVEQYWPLSEVCAELESVLQSGYIYPYLVESMVWRFVKREVFDPKSKLWAGEIGEKFDDICGKITGCVEEFPVDEKTSFNTAFHEWRSRSVSFLVDLGLDRKSGDDTTARKMMEELRQFISPKPSLPRFSKRSLRDAAEIIRKAVDINIQLRKSKAYLSLIFPGAVRSIQSRFFGFSFDARIMDKISLGLSSDQLDQTSPPIVDMAISPCLIKRGNADGTNYESTKVLAKMRVVCDLDAFFNGFNDEEDDEEVDNDNQSAMSGHATVTSQHPKNNEGDADASVHMAPEYSPCMDSPIPHNGEHGNKEKTEESTIIVAAHASAKPELEEQEGGACDVAESKRDSPETSPLTVKGEVVSAEMVYPHAENAEGSSEAMDLDGGADLAYQPPAPKVDHDGDLQMESV
ncbi:hypothetical protein GE21DRAFT_6121 [Neurospora crassa]|uniref:Uncharacterized protein n=2 Tax=Neurospora crassa TaxID=5141 RepID=Q7RZ76_NEUCR|nr:hypothetical protein NCU04397 [Neurospora crassa OR74A]EAA28238.1 hypothetical protein NCU04397 [Neurospora crassa OR74A]KHE88546.1 hypothetical protein GE21DRAFT_6121 [Neurospora crassa]CAF06051.1 hypothetical protein 29E8.180 [Neurospora crassa]|eukprot:XP_957474.1 hypothetical protein NCU04397 [Neurospora crassa OR74A]